MYVVAVVATAASPAAGWVGRREKEMKFLLAPVGVGLIWSVCQKNSLAPRTKRLVHSFSCSGRVDCGHAKRDEGQEGRSKRKVGTPKILL